MYVKNKFVLCVVLLGALVMSGCGKKNITVQTEEGTPAVKEEVEADPESLDGQEDQKQESSDTDIAEIQIENEEEETQVQEREIQKNGILIALDPGHQGWNIDMSDMEANAPGSDIMKTKATGGTSGQYSGIPEFQLNLDIALLVRDRLIEQGYDVIMTREDNETAISNAQRATLANDMGADISVRIHANGSEDPGAGGALILIGSAENPYVGNLYENSYRLGDCVLNAYCEETGMQNIGIQTNDTMTGINWSKIPVIILEMGFMTNEQDDLNMSNADYRIRMADGIVKGINAYYGY